MGGNQMVKNIGLTITADNPIIKNHTIFGQKLLPGLAYIDLLYQLCGHVGMDYKKYCIKNLAILQPLAVTDAQPIPLNLTFEEKEGIWAITVKNEQALEPAQELYATAEMQEEVKNFHQSINIEEMKGLAEQCFTMEAVYEKARQQDLLHKGLIKAEGNCYIFDSEVLIEVRVPRQEGEVSPYLFHPALLDGAAMAGGSIRGDGEDSENLYIPLCYEYFYCTENLTGQCFVRVRKSSVKEVNEIRTSDLEIYNSQGIQIGELSGVTSKKIRYRGQIYLTEDNKDKKVALNARTAEQEEARGRSETVTEIEEKLIEIFEKYLEIDSEQISKEIGFFELGLESSQLLLVHQDIEKEMNLKLGQTLLFEYSTITELARYLEKQFNEGLPVEEMIRSQLINNLQQNREEDIAIIGMSGYFPHARNLDEFWDNLMEGRDCISEVPKDRWDYKKYQDIKTPSGKNISKWGGFIDDVAGFDAEFFRISPREAEIIDPQERLFLQCCWKTIEDAGYTPKTLVKPRGKNKRNDVGVFVGVMHKDYSLIGLEVLNSGNLMPLSLNYAPIANRVSYFCNFHGPSMALDTVCSSSLLSVHLAIDSIKKGECEVALAGGVNLSLHPAKYLSYGLAEMHSSHGRCNTFGENADGYVSSDGIGAVLLKPLSKAIKDKDNIYAVIKGSTINHGGSASGITVPNPTAQGELITACFEKTNINPRTISYVEAHGTGTSLGDPIEIQGLVNAFLQYTKDLQYCSIGSVKSNIGHAESAAGISSLIKVALQLHKRTLVPSLHSENINEILDFKSTPFYVQRKTEPWNRMAVQTENGEKICKRRASISSFGATGSNAHVILEEYEQEEIKQKETAEQQEEKTSIVLSAKNEERLREYVMDLLYFLKKHEKEKNLTLQSLAYTLQVGRVSFEERLVFLADSMENLKEQMQRFLDRSENVKTTFRGNAKKPDETITLLSRDLDSMELLRKWMERGKQENIAQLWVKGMDIDWILKYKKELPKRISLPTYPFAKDTYWLIKLSDNQKAEMIPDSVAESESRQIAEENVMSLKTEKVKTTLKDIYKNAVFPKKPQLTQLPPATHNKKQLEKIIKELIHVVSNELKVGARFIDENTDINDIGLDMRNMNNILNKINSNYQINLDYRALLEQKTIRGIADYLIKNGRFGVDIPKM